MDSYRHGRPPFIGLWDWKRWDTERRRRLPPAEVPVARDDVRELHESMESFPEGVVAIDGTIAPDGTFYVFEIQGLDAGVRGIGDIDEADISPELRRLASTWGSESYRKYSNPNWFRAISDDKRRQGQFIPEINRPQTVMSGDFNYLFRRGRVVVKPPDEAQGNGIRIFDTTQIEAAHEYARNVERRYGGFVAQIFIESKGADRAPEDIKGHATSMRLIVPFKMVDGRPVATISHFGYQRVARYSVNEVGEKIRGVRVKVEDTGVVNRARGAAAVAMSDREFRAALPVALQIIENLSAYGKTTPEHAKNISNELDTRARSLYFDLRDSQVSIDYTSARTGKTEEGLWFMRQVERELAMIDTSVWDSKPMRNKNYRPKISRIPNSNHGSIELKDKRGRKGSYTFSLDDQGALGRLLQRFVEENKVLL